MKHVRIPQVQITFDVHITNEQGQVIETAPVRSKITEVGYDLTLSDAVDQLKNQLEEKINSEGEKGEKGDGDR